MAGTVEAVQATAAAPAELFLMQHTGSWATVHFPPAWRAFKAWYLRESANASATPCVPTLISNQWWTRSHNSVWTAWHMRWAYEHGLYGINFNFPQLPRGWHLGLCVNSRTSGENFKTTTDSDSNEMVLQPPPPDRELPELADLDVYDFHFRRFRPRRTALQFRKHIFTHFPAEDMCYWVHPLGSYSEYVKTGKLPE